ncbi:secreted RxLR effector peptide protein, putative [Phytophthora infestans T30-4]|uniref:Secreted RxLR effector peptide protein, putative n=1 Tax=Phytophthora infestans (strain T30-4) TaxID=403677 RepID=D0NZQ8_PHYIT|nr:secreted RxLR effector peptide protein, putative [Phytophthora infestans T30-4]EEY69623.1 secreted RxLR effector peptide protein, putative [Phytophthora infestans T30-4]|eukprot:XP_002997184.1 secreted RxLR effector peptide protein, putative [Phytophthora infestans T30-4]
MRLVLLTELSTLVVLFAPTEAVSLDIPGCETKIIKWKYASTPTIRSSPTEVNVSEKRSLRGDDSSMDMEVLNPDDEERAAPLLSRFAFYMKAILYGLTLRVTPNTQWKWTPLFEQRLFSLVHKVRGPPEFAEIKNPRVAARYKDWFQKTSSRKTWLALNRYGNAGKT